MKPITKAVLLEYAKWYLEAHRGLRWKRKYPKTKTEKKLSEKLLCVLLIRHQSYSFPLKKPFAKTVLVEFAKWNLEAHWGLWWKRTFLPLKTEKKISEKLLRVLLIYLTELQLSPQEVFAKTVYVGFAKWYLEDQRGLWWKRNSLPLKTGKKLSEKLLCVLLIHFTYLQLFPQEAFR